MLDAKVQCSDPRDQLFGVLSLLDWPDRQKPKADYGNDRYEVALDVTRLVHRCGPVITQELCHTFQITGEEASLRRTFDLHSSTPPETIRWNQYYPNDNDQLYGNWRGLEVRGTTEALRHSGQRFMSFQK